MDKTLFNKRELEIIDIDKQFKVQKIIFFTIILLFLALIVILLVGVNYGKSEGAGNIILENISFSDKMPMQVTLILKNIGDADENGFSLDILSEGKKTSLQENLPLKPNQTANYGFQVNSKDIEIYFNGKRVY